MNRVVSLSEAGPAVRDQPRVAGILGKLVHRLGAWLNGALAKVPPSEPHLP